MQSKKKKLGVGLRGTGQVAVQHVAAFSRNEHTYIAAVCGRDYERAKQFAARYAPDAVVYRHYEEMLLSSEVDIVSECMPNYLHAPEGIAALQAGKHLLLEKPAGITPEEVDALYRTAVKSDRTTIVSFLTRWIPLTAALKNLIDTGAIGDIYYAQTDYWHGIKPTFASYPWIRKQEFAGGAMITGGCHAADAARYLNGEITEVFAYACRAREDFNYDTTFAASAKFANGSVGRISASLDGLAFPYQFNIDLLGTKGAVRNNRIYSDKLFAKQTDWVCLPMVEPNTGSVDHHPFHEEIDEFVSGIRSGTPIRSTVTDACKSMDVALAITESARTGKPVAVRPRDEV
jgi:predicted dehydrogenase